MSKKLYLILSILVAFSMVMAGCASNETSQSSGEEGASQPQAGEKVTLRVLVHQNPPMVTFMEEFNKKFQANHPDITVDMSVVGSGDLATVTQTRLSANDVDIVDLFGFANAAQSYMKMADPPNWQQLIDAGYLMDLTDQPFVKNYDAAAIKDAGTYNGKVYAINLGRITYSGIFYNKDLFAANNVKVPTVWSELVAACETFKNANIACMTAGGQDGWPIFVGAYGLIGSIFPDQAALVEGLWTGTLKWNDAKSLEMWKKMQVYVRDMMEPGAVGITNDGAPGRFASGAVAMLPGGSWMATAIDTAAPSFKWGYIPFPGSDNADDNKYLFGKYDQGWAVAAKTPNKDAAMLWLTEFSTPENYQAWTDAVGFIPTQANAKLGGTLGTEIASYLANFRVGYEQYWIAPKGAGEFANPFATYFKPFGTYDDPQVLADKVQADLQAGLDAVK
jgi:raffinose/stachyose/melibiose transport system substrate-binding protein